MEGLDGVGEEGRLCQDSDVVPTELVCSKQPSVSPVGPVEEVVRHGQAEDVRD